ncbi:hypothetical protein G7Z17_g9679 [Cylindrodendrum hubeiense]|uniref:Non-reducing end beta-L-arabinofuranosidase n=1 Tax=Cylindrodendrum hubeiense TaxID=595255 RepID=A0A9P5H4J2_9HYPO|nr:hypothetical protein G7Z17_g9679 [Cylindrodendrum hubeiense]
MAHPQVTFRDTTFTGKSLLSTRRTTVSRSTVRAQLEQIRSTGRYDCFNLKWHSIYEDKSMWPVPFHLFWDSDIAKWIEGACYFLADEYDAEIDSTIREFVDMIRGAQQEDGYLNVHYTVVEPGKRWSNLRDMHELYNAGHLIEAAIAHRDYYRNDLLISPIQKYVSLIGKQFGPGPDQVHGYPGHPEIELALFRLYSATGSIEAFELAQYFLTERGNPKGQDGKHYYDWEMERRGDEPWLRPDAYPENRTYWYCQAHAPIVEQPTIEGHSVRAIYLLTAVADMIHLSQTADRPLSDSKVWSQAVHRLWDNMVEKKMYLTGGIGAIKQWEGFGIDYFLPQGTDEGGCYAETCASIAVMMLAERLLHLDLDGHYADIMELCLFNNIMTSMSLDGKTFTYANQLASSETDKSERHEWFWCACCPPNVSRLFGSLGGYIWDYGSEGDGAFINVHLYTGAKVTFDANGASVSLEQKSNWPWEGNILFKLSASSPLQATIRLRLPAWSNGSYILTPSSQPGTVEVKRGYIRLTPAYTTDNPSFSLQVGGFEPRYLTPHRYTNQRTLTLARGPIVYCVEDVDNSGEKNHFKDTHLKADSHVSEHKCTDEQTGEEYVTLRSVGWNRPGTGGASSASGEVTGEERELNFIPYYFRANRGGEGHMRVGLLNGGDVSGILFPERARDS